MGRKKVTVHAPRNVDLPAHVVMIPAGSGSSGSSDGSTITGKKDANNSGKKCLCLWSWLTGLILLCVGVVVIAHYMLTDTSRTAVTDGMRGRLQADQVADQVSTTQMFLQST